MIRGVLIPRSTTCSWIMASCHEMFSVICDMRFDLFLPLSYAVDMPVSPPPIITFTTDFGTSDSYVAAMKGAALRLCPQAKLIDVTHAVPPHDVLFGAIMLERAITSFPD